MLRSEDRNSRHEQIEMTESSKKFKIYKLKKNFR